MSKIRLYVSLKSTIELIPKYSSFDNYVIYGWDIHWLFLELTFERKYPEKA